MNIKKGHLPSLLYRLARYSYELKVKRFFKCCESFLRKSSVCTFTDLNPGFCGPWNILLIFLGYGTFVMLKKKPFGQKKFEFHARVQKCHFGNFSILTPSGVTMKYCKNKAQIGSILT